MHQLNVLVIGPDSFIFTLSELRPYLKFNFSTDINYLKKKPVHKFDVILFHEKIIKNREIKEIIDNFSTIKIVVSAGNETRNTYDGTLKLPVSLNDINTIVDNSVAKKAFSKNSSIKIKNFTIDKNEKKLIGDGTFLILTEKEIQLLELFLDNKKPITKNEILTSVWHYSSDADTHTVETHIYRLRKKINDKFSIDQFILNNKEGYYL
tara:strand:- start:432 stop:1055 length:624 start_codon:yes stop_codon:yes gene_type:complete